MREMSGTISDKYFAMGIKNPCLKLTFDNKKMPGLFLVTDMQTLPFGFFEPFGFFDPNS